MPNSQPFDKRMIEKIKADAVTNVVDRLDAIALTAHRRLVGATPVDFGQARAGWNFALNEPSAAIPAGEPGVGAQGKKGTVYSAPAIPVPTAQKAGDGYYISNTTEHIVYLNEGTSTQAATNFIEIEVAEAVKDVERAGI